MRGVIFVLQHSWQYDYQTAISYMEGHSNLYKSNMVQRLK